jgi:hypothetical protein
MQAPLGTYSGWNIRKAGFSEGDSCDLTGAFIPFFKTQPSGWPLATRGFLTGALPDPRRLSRQSDCDGQSAGAADVRDIATPAGQEAGILFARNGLSDAEPHAALFRICARSLQQCAQAVDATIWDENGLSSRRVVPRRGLRPGGRGEGVSRGSDGCTAGLQNDALLDDLIPFGNMPRGRRAGRSHHRR